MASKRKNTKKRIKVKISDIKLSKFYCNDYYELSFDTTIYLANQYNLRNRINF